MLASTKRLRWLAAVAVIAVLAVACGSGSRSADPSGSGNSGNSGSESDSGSETASGDFGTLESPCGDGDASGATQQGVTDTEITIAYGDDAGFQGQPGLNHEMSDAVKAMIEWCNEQGGINGRQVKGNYYDAKILDVNTAMQEACAQTFMLVGQGWALDGSAEQTRISCGLAAVPGYTGSSALAMGPDVVQPVPNPIDELTIQQAYALAEAFPDKVTKAAAVLSASLPASIESVGKVKATYPQAGWNFLPCDQTYQISGEADWKPFAQRLKDCGAEMVTYSGAENNFQNLLDASAQLGYNPVWFTEANFYTQTFAAWNSSGNADQVYVKDIYVPLEDPPADSATAKYIEIVEESGGDISQLGAQASSAFLLWATAAKACGSELTKECIFEEIEKIEEWTGGGLHAPTNPGSNMPPSCGLVLKLDGTKFVRFDPTEKGELECSDDYVAKVTGKVVDDAKLGPDRISTLYKK